MKTSGITIYAIRYTDKNGNSAATTFSNKEQLNDILKGAAKNSTAETRLGNTMPIDWHNAIVAHNKKVNKK